MSSPVFSANDLRKKFLNFFKARGHKVIPPSSLVPENDPTVLFTTAGMHPLVSYLQGERHPEGKLLVNIQPCLRMDDIEEVGDTYHHTFFEMMGNWSLGDYWKEDAIKWSWEFLTDELKIEKNKIAISCFAGDDDPTSPNNELRGAGAPRDDQSANIWKSLGINEKRIKFLGKKDNWWGPAGQTGPCGPDTEMFVWVGEGEPPEEFAGPEDPRWVEAWNDVFMEYDKKLKVESEKLKEDNEQKYEFVPLAQKNVDTGMGFERMLAVLNNTDDDYKTELFWPIIEKLEEISGKKYSSPRHSDPELAEGEESLLRSFRVIADHVKASVFILAEGITPSNKLQGYVLRRLIRRAIVKAKQIGIEKNFCAELVDSVRHSGLDPESRSLMSERSALREVRVPPPNRDSRMTKIWDDIRTELDKEETKFRNVLIEAIKIEKQEIGDIKDIFNVGGDATTASGLSAFRLESTHGIPHDLYLEDLKSEIPELDISSVEKIYLGAEKSHQELSRAGIGQFKGGLADAKEETTKLHTAAHLLHAALRRVLGDHVLQKGSNITAERLRFDFSHPEKLTDEQIKQVEGLVNEQIQKNLPVKMEEMAVDEAKKSGALGVFDERYGNKVKVYTIGFDPSTPDARSGTREFFSCEICGGPHTKQTGELGHFKITNEMSSSAGIRRIKAVLN